MTDNEKHRKYRAKKTPSLEWLLSNKDYQGDDCLIWPFSRKKTGYGRYNVAGEECNAHRKMCLLVHGNPPSSRHHAAHSCGKGHEGCVSPKHVHWATPAENIAEKKKHGTYQWGFQNPSAKLSPETLKIAREAKAEKPGDLKRLAASLGISRETLRFARTGRTYQ